MRLRFASHVPVTIVSALMLFALLAWSDSFNPPTAIAAPNLDPSFGTSGIVAVPFPARVNGLALGSGGQVIVVGDCGAGSSPNICVARYQTDGSLDPSFDGDGNATTDMGEQSVTATAVAVQSDGKTVVAARCSSASELSNFCVARFGVDGSLDDTFGGDGRVETDFPISPQPPQYSFSADDNPRAIAVQADGKVVVAGYCDYGYNTVVFCVARYNIDGSLDASFDGDGRVMSGSPGNSYSASSAVTILPADAGIVLAGNCGDGGLTSYFCLARFNVDGGLDSDFSGDGWAVTSVTGADVAVAVSSQGDGKVIGAGRCGLIPHFCLIRYESDGSLDPSFGAGGVVDSAPDTPDEEVAGVAVEGDGKIVAAGGCGYPLSGPPPDYHVCLARYDSAGVLDPSFGTAGRLTVSSGVSRAVAIQSDQKIVIAGKLASVPVPALVSCASKQVSRVWAVLLSGPT